MTNPLGDPNVRQMRLRYAGRCRVCGANLAAGTFAVYERSRRAVRCITCVETTSSVDGSADADQAADEPDDRARSTAELSPRPTPSPTDRADEQPVGRSRSADDLRLRAPASAVIAELLRVQSSAPPRSASVRFFGRSPLLDESQSWYSGAIGELEVGRLLDRLDGAWLVIHAVPIGTSGSDIDHLVVGPGGVFTINTKYHEGKKVWVASRRLLVNGQRTDHLRNAAFEAKRVAKLLTEATGRPVEVTPIVAIVAARSITIRERPADVVVLTSDQLVRWLQRRPKVVDDDQVGRLAGVVLNPATWGDPAIPAADLEAFAALRTSVGSARRRRQMWALLALFSPIALAAATFFAVSR